MPTDIARPAGPTTDLNATIYPPPSTKAPKLDRNPLVCQRCGGKFMLHFEVKEMWRSPYKNTSPMYGAAGQFRAYCADCLGQVFPESRIFIQPDQLRPDIEAILEEMKGTLAKMQENEGPVPEAVLSPEIRDTLEAMQGKLEGLESDIKALKASRGGRKKK